MSLHVGVQIWTTSPWERVRAGARLAEELGYDSVWVADHLRTRGDARPILEAWVTLAALAVEVKRVRLGPLVTPVGFRHPALVANMTAALDHVSNGRAILGLGAGWFEEEYSAYGLPFGDPGERYARLGEACQLTTALLREEVVSFSGRFYHVTDGRCLPKPVQSHVPLLVAGHGPGAVRAAARFADVWNVIALPDEISPYVRRLHAALKQEDRPADAVLATVSFRFGAPAPGDATDHYRLLGDDPAVVDQLRRYVAAGVRGFIVQSPPEDVDGLERFLRLARSVEVDVP
jgi:alkanesulfonate monooxygenase SsuD/methylene tetrahydromethanopterin reductase-like flavin-dependent oxidoreductase (luciferase family)